MMHCFLLQKAVANVGPVAMALKKSVIKYKPSLIFSTSTVNV